ncbi:MAG TPA: hypothetical protein VLM37_01960 [Fibrobacteraceae bacterium]|nr:hypothetical protein [Fibrobacteraceae bacterium]
MIRVVEWIVLFLLLMLVAGCGIKNAGTSTETTNGVALILLDGDSTPVAFARVVLYATESDSILDTALADSMGVTALNWDEALVGNLEVTSPDSSTMLWSWNRKATEFSDSTILLIPQSCRMHVYTSEKEIRILRLLSSPYQAQSVNDTFTFAHIPAGSWTLVHQPDSTDSTHLIALGHAVVSSGDTVVTNLDSNTQTVLEDFEDADSRHNLAVLTGSTGWYFNALNSASWLQPLDKADFAAAVFADSSGINHYLALRFILPTDSSMTLVGTHFADSGSTFDLSALQSISIRMRGDGVVSFAMENPASVGDTLFRKAIWSTTVDSNWHDYTFSPGGEVLWPEIGEVDFSSIADSIGFVTFFMQSGSWLDVDDLVLEGVVPSTFTP